MHKEEKEELRKQIRKVEGYLIDKKNIIVLFERDIGNFYCDDIITINNRQNLRYQLHTLLHEAGHALIRGNKRRFLEKYPSLSMKKNSKSYRLDTLKEEMEAWNRGYNLASRLSIELNERWWKRHSEECLYDYVKWVVNV